MKSNGIRRTLVVLLALIFLVVAATPALAADRNRTRSAEEAAPATVVTDVLILRPLGMVTTALGTAMFAASLPIALLVAPTQIGTPFSILVKRPVRYVWVDKLGTH